MARLRNCGSVEQWRQGDSCAEVRLIGALDYVVRWHGSSAMLRRYPRWFVSGWRGAGVVIPRCPRHVTDTRISSALGWLLPRSGEDDRRSRTTISVKSRWPMFGSVLRCLRASAIAWRCLSTFHDLGRGVAVFGDAQPRVATFGDVRRHFACMLLSSVVLDLSWARCR